jgi:glycosyltransferase involved in cell wall biosynthesis
MRYAAIKHNKISSISSQPFHSFNEEIKIIEVPDYLSHISSKDLILYGRIKDNQIVHRLIKKPTNKLKIALVSNWKSQCGLSTYIDNLFPEIVKQIGSFKILMEKTDFPIDDIYQLGQQTMSADQVSACWKRGESLQELVNQIKDYGPDIILINHEWGIFPDPKHWLSFITQLSDFRIITIMHSVFPNHLDKVIVEASMSEIIVHLEQAKKCLLEEKHITAKISVIPHGCYPLQNKAPLWNIYKSNNTFIQVGFGLRYKAFEDSIKATALLKEKYPDVFFTAIFSESNFGKDEHQIYYQELVELINQLGIKDNVGIVRGFQSDNCLDSYFRTNKVAVFPYKSFGEHFVYGASGACRLAMSKGIPVITSLIPHFSDTPSIKADTPKEIAAELDRLFSQPQLRQQQIDKQNQFILDNSWERIAQQYVAVFENNPNAVI